MNQQRQKLSYKSLVSRTDFYKKKALELEQKAVFADEKIQMLKRELEKFRESDRSGEIEEIQDRFERLKNDYEALKEKGSADEIAKLTEELQEKTREAEALREKAEDGEKAKDNNRIKQFEQLLSEVQTELNDKEQQLEKYKSRVKSLEKRLSSQNTTPVQKVYSEVDESKKTDKKGIAYFDYSIILDQQKETIIRGNFHIENVGRMRLSTPYVCFRFYPLDASTLKGKIISLEQAERSGDGGSDDAKWVYVDDDWGEKAKERGEIWTRPYGEIQLLPDDKTVLPDFQIPVKKHFDEKVIVEGFVYFQDERYKLKASNQILITF